MRHQYAHFLSQLSSVLGRESARQELRWMMQASQTINQQPSMDLSNMVARRLSGEPLQYILGTWVPHPSRSVV
jgi:release factor glutamine methyltransferase